MAMNLEQSGKCPLYESDISLTLMHILRSVLMHLTDGGKEDWYCNKEVAQASGCSTPNKQPKPDHLKWHSEPTGFIGLASGEDMVTKTQLQCF